MVDRSWIRLEGTLFDRACHPVTCPGALCNRRVYYHCRKIAVAGRSLAKLKEAVDEFGSHDITIPVIDKVDCSKPASLLAVACRTQVLINCVGPYRHYGEPVVQACIATRTDYLDVCGEPGVPSLLTCVPGLAFCLPATANAAKRQSLQWRRRTDLHPPRVEHA